MFSVDLESFRRALTISGHDPNFGTRYLTDETRDFLKKYEATSSLLSFLEKNSFSSNKMFGKVYFDAANDLAKHNLVEENRKCVENGLLIIGSGPNGDPIVVDMNTLEVGYVFHDELWENDSGDIQNSVVRMKCSVGMFFEIVATDPGFPVDAYEAEDYMAKNFGAGSGGNAAE